MPANVEFISRHYARERERVWVCPSYSSLCRYPHPCWPSWRAWPAVSLSLCCLNMWAIFSSLLLSWSHAVFSFLFFFFSLSPPLSHPPALFVSAFVAAMHNLQTDLNVYMRAAILFACSHKSHSWLKLTTATSDQGEGRGEGFFILFANSVYPTASAAPILVQDLMRSPSASALTTATVSAPAPAPAPASALGNHK